MSTEVKTKGHFRSHLGFYSMLLLALGALGYVWFSGASEIKRLKKTQAIELSMIKAEADSLLQVQTAVSQSLTAKTLAYSVSSLSQEERTQYFDQLVKYKGIDIVAYEQTNKMINSSSKRSYLSKSLIEVLNVKMNYQNTDTQTFLQEDKTVVCHPVIHNGKIEGTLILVFPKASL